MVGKRLDLTGNNYGRLTVLEYSHNVGKKTYWKCKCICGNIISARSDCLKSGDIKSCKCLNYEAKVVRHGQARTKLYHVWASMRNRCNNPNDRNFKHYGGRGLKVDVGWDTDFVNFYEWSKLSGYKEGLTIDRIDVNEDYKPSNCRWVTIQEQQLNKRDNVYLSYKGETKTIKEWSQVFNCTYNLFYGRLKKYNNDIEKVIQSL